MNKEITLEQWCAYLPYGLKVIHARKKGNIQSTSELTPSDFTWLINQEYVRPILRPLTDLTKEIEVDGELLKYIDILEQDEVNDYLQDCNIWTQRLFEEQKLLCIELIPHGIIEKLLSWHFDIHNLIEQGLAIDINTLNK